MSDPAPSLLTPLQRKLAGFALGSLALAGIGLLVCGLILVAGRLLSHFSGVLWPLASAGILALILRPLVDLLEHGFGLPRTRAVGLLFGGFLLVLVGLALLVLPPLITQFVDFFTYVPRLWGNLVSYVDQHYPAWLVTAKRHLENPAVQQVLDAVGGDAKELLSKALPSLRAAGGGLLVFLGFLTHLAIVPVYLFFFLLMRGEPTDRLGEHLPFLKKELRDDVVFLAREFVAIVVSFFRGQLLIGLLMGCLLALGFSLIGLKFGLFLGLAVGFLNIIPYLGTVLGLLITLPLAFLQPGGGLSLVGLVLVIKILVQTFEGWFLTPRIMGARTGLHPAAILFALFFWGRALDGVFGMILAIPLTAFVVTAWRLAKHKYFA